MIRSVEALVDEQARRWALPREERRHDVRRPVITVARQHGARGTDLARRLAEDLGFDVFDQEIIHRIAESTHRSERVVTALDERNRELLTDWLAAFANPELHEHRGVPLAPRRAWSGSSPTRAAR